VAVWAILVLMLGSRWTVEVLGGVRMVQSSFGSAGVAGIGRKRGGVTSSGLALGWVE